MVLKKQTVWLLTMLSLIVVLSVYYVTTPTKSPTAASTQTKNQSTTSNSSAKLSTGVTSSVTSASDLFASYKLKRDQQTSTLAQQYEAVIASDTSTAQQVNAATDKLTSLDSEAKQETQLEQEIISKGFGTDAVVTKKGAYADVYVQAKNLSSKQASEIMALVVNSPLGVQFANVKYQTTNS